MLKTINNSGIYIIELFTPVKLSIPHKRFGLLHLRKGYYYYVGSAQKYLEERIKRHLKKEKKLHWHIDYLTSNKNFKITNIYIFENKSKENECITVSNLERFYNLIHPVKNFGNSDCNNCVSHLLYSPVKLAVDTKFVPTATRINFI